MHEAPDFSLPDQFGSNHSLADYRGKWVVLYFYPKDDTPGCTAEACSFRDAFADYNDRGIQVLGISADSVKSHARFAKKYHLDFPLLADTDRKVIWAYGAWGPKKLFGREYDGIIRKTFVITPDGGIHREYPQVTPEGHAEQILADIGA